MSSKLELYRPDGIFPSVPQIPFRELNENGRINVIFDYHNTLSRHPWAAIDRDILWAIEHAIRDGYINGLAIASNVIIPPRIGRIIGIIQPIQRSAEAIDATPFYLGYFEKKPGPRGIQRVLREMEWEPANTIVVGDQLIDIRAAHSAGCRGVLVSPFGFQVPWVLAKRPKECYIRWRLGLTRVQPTSL